MPLVFWVEFGFEPPWWVHILLWPLPVLNVALALLHPMKGLLVAQQFRHTPSDSGTVDYSAPDLRCAPPNRPPAAGPASGPTSAPTSPRAVRQPSTARSPPVTWTPFVCKE